MRLFVQSSISKAITAIRCSIDTYYRAVRYLEVISSGHTKGSGVIWRGRVIEISSNLATEIGKTFFPSFCNFSR